MPEFSTPFSSQKSERKLTKEELIRTIRFSIAAEFEAIQLYEEIEEAIDDEKSKKLLQEVTEDEKVHVGNFLYLLKQLAPEESESYGQGVEEAEKLLNDKKK